MYQYCALLSFLACIMLSLCDIYVSARLGGGRYVLGACLSVHASVHHQTWEHDIFKTKELVLMLIGTSVLYGKGMKLSTLAVRRSKV